MEVWLAASRFMQFAAAATLFGLPAFTLYGFGQGVSDHDRTWVRSAVTLALVTAWVGAVVVILAQTAAMTGEAVSAFDPTSVWAVISDTYFGMIWSIRIGILALMSVVAVVLPRRLLLITICGGLVAASLAWLGHGGEGAGLLGELHRLADIVHILTASFWIGALIMLVLALRAGDRERSLLALTRFSGVGLLVVAAIALSGVINAWAILMPIDLDELFSTAYAPVLIAKIVLFGAMLVLAVANRFVLTPLLASDHAGSIAALRWSISAETALAVLVLVMVAVLGVLEPPST